MPLILRLLAWLIVFYQRWLSGRGPLRSVRCSFAPHESCSAFGLRAAREAPTARAALGRIVRRIRRCGDACLVTDGHALSWTPFHDRNPSEIAGEMRADGEGRVAIEQMLRARRAVAIWRADLSAIHACDAILADPLAAAAPRVVLVHPVAAAPRVVSEPAVRQRARRRLVAFAVIAAAAIGVVFVLPWIGGIALGCAATAGTLSARTTLGRERRFELHRTWARRRAT